MDTRTRLCDLIRQTGKNSHSRGKTTLLLNPEQGNLELYSDGQEAELTEETVEQWIMYLS